MKTFLPLVFLALSLSATAELPSAENKTTVDSIVVEKKISNRTHKVALYPDATQKVLFFNVRGLSGKVYQLFVFDMHGKIVKQAEIRNKQTTLINNIEKGTYLFEVFSDDDRIGEGKIAVL
ncbi:MAG: T9SS type A sorting domain-containing protein [Chitinophagaceae bacterium]|nr:T9SS type A sorting domain-containing protein [Chitinophagaceae bacterium]